jgi:hypothetical protein
MLDMLQYRHAKHVSQALAEIFLSRWAQAWWSELLCGERVEAEPARPSNFGRPGAGVATKLFSVTGRFYLRSGLEGCPPR